MRLLNTETLCLEEFVTEKAGQYAILSHRWSDDEISHQDFLEGRRQDGPGFAKIKNFCAVALASGHRWAWVDTCCMFH